MFTKILKICGIIEQAVESHEKRTQLILFSVQDRNLSAPEWKEASYFMDNV